MVWCISFLSSLIYASGTRVTVNIIENPNLSGKEDKSTSISTIRTLSTWSNLRTWNILLPIVNKQYTTESRDMLSLNKADEYPIISNVRRIIKILKTRIEEEDKTVVIENGSGEILNLVISSDSGSIEHFVETEKSLFDKIGSFIRASVISYNYSLLETILSAIKWYPMNILSLTVFKTAAFTELFGFR